MPYIGGLLFSILHLHLVYAALQDTVEAPQPVCVCVCVCVIEREEDGESLHLGETKVSYFLNLRVS